MLDLDYRTPGQLIQGLLAQRGWNQNVLAIVLGIDRKIINRIVAGDRPVDAEIAIALSELFHIPAEWFLELQQKYDLARAKLTIRDDPKRATRAYLFGDLP